MIHSKDDIIELVNTLGFLPFFKNNIKGFSIEEMCPKELWFSNENDGPWEWKGPIIREGECMYGKFFCGKAGFVAKRFVPDFVNYRRDGYDFDSRFDDELAPFKDKSVFDTVDENKVILSKELKRICNYNKNGNKGFETVITRLQMQTYVTVSDFKYMHDRNGKKYGWASPSIQHPSISSAMTSQEAHIIKNRSPQKQYCLTASARYYTKHPRKRSNES